MAYGTAVVGWVDVVLDRPRAVVDGVASFWAQVTGGTVSPWRTGHTVATLLPDDGDAYLHVRSVDRRGPLPGSGRQPGPPVRLLLQRLEEHDGPSGMHVDLACADRTVTAARHVATGARVVGRGRRWTVLHDPSGTPYCLTDRDPQTPRPPDPQTPRPPDPQTPRPPDPQTGVLPACRPDGLTA